MTDTSRPRVLIIKLSSLGDLFNPLPSVRLLKQHLDAEIDWVTQPEYVEVVQCFDDVSAVFAFPRRRYISGFPGFVKQLRARRYDVVLDMQGLQKSGLIAGLARSVEKIGPSFAREGSRIFYHTIASGEGRDRHAVEQCMDSIRSIGVPGGPAEFPVTFPVSEVKAPVPRIALVPCSRWPAKNWPVDHFAELGKLLHERCTASLYLVGGAADAAVCETLARSIGGSVHNTCGQTSLAGLGGLLGEMDLVISNDSGPMHMAAAAGARVLGLFGPTDPARTGPYGPQHTVIQAPSFKAGTFRNHDYKKAGNSLMREITVDRVLEQVLRMLEE